MISLKWTLFFVNLALLVWLANSKNVYPPNNPRQIRAGSATYNSSIHQDGLDYLVKFFVFATTNKYFQDYGEDCDPTVHEYWTDPANGKNLTSPTDYYGNSSWHNKICNMLSYLDCQNKTCQCAGPSTFDLKLVFEPQDDPKLDNEKPNKKKRRCRVQTGEICDYVRIKPVPNITFPGIDFDINDFFECETGSGCVNVGKENDGYIYQRCVSNNRGERGGQTIWNLIFFPVSIFIHSLSFY